MKSEIYECFIDVPSFAGMNDCNNTFNTQDLRDSLKALLPNASINVLSTPQGLQHSRLRNNYMQPSFAAGQNSSSEFYCFVFFFLCM